MLQRTSKDRGHAAMAIVTAAALTLILTLAATTVSVDAVARPGEPAFFVPTSLIEEGPDAVIVPPEAIVEAYVLRTHLLNTTTESAVYDRSCSSRSAIRLDLATSVHGMFYVRDGQLYANNVPESVMIFMFNEGPITVEFDITCSDSGVSGLMNVTFVTEFETTVFAFCGTYGRSIDEGGEVLCGDCQQGLISIGDSPIDYGMGVDERWCIPQPELVGEIAGGITLRANGAEDQVNSLGENGANRKFFILPLTEPDRFNTIGESPPSLNRFSPLLNLSTVTFERDVVVTAVRAVLPAMSSTLERTQFLINAGLIDGNYNLLQNPPSSCIARKLFATNQILADCGALDLIDFGDISSYSIIFHIPGDNDPFTNTASISSVNGYVHPRTMDCVAEPAPDLDETPACPTTCGAVSVNQVYTPVTTYGQAGGRPCFRDLHERQCGVQLCEDADDLETVYFKWELQGFVNTDPVQTVAQAYFGDAYGHVVITTNKVIFQSVAPFHVEPIFYLEARTPKWNAASVVNFLNTYDDNFISSYPAGIVMGSTVTVVTDPIEFDGMHNIVFPPGTDFSNINCPMRLPVSSSYVVNHENGTQTLVLPPTGELFDRFFPLFEALFNADDEPLFSECPNFGDVLFVENDEGGIDSVHTNNTRFVFDNEKFVYGIEGPLDSQLLRMIDQRNVFVPFSCPPESLTEMPVCVAFRVDASQALGSNLDSFCSSLRRESSSDGTVSNADAHLCYDCINSDQTEHDIFATVFPETTHMLQCSNLVPSSKYPSASYQISGEGICTPHNSEYELDENNSVEYFYDDITIPSTLKAMAFIITVRTSSSILEDQEVIANLFNNASVCVEGIVHPMDTYLGSVTATIPKTPQGQSALLIVPVTNPSMFPTTGNFALTLSLTGASNNVIILHTSFARLRLYTLEPVSCEVSSWSAWGQCTVGCGAGTRNRTREVVTAKSIGGLPCPHLFEEEHCNLDPCVDEDHSIRVFLEKYSPSNFIAGLTDFYNNYVVTLYGEEEPFFVDLVVYPSHEEEFITSLQSTEGIFFPHIPTITAYNSSLSRTSIAHSPVTSFINAADGKNACDGTKITLDNDMLQYLALYNMSAFDFAAIGDPFSVEVEIPLTTSLVPFGTRVYASLVQSSATSCSDLEMMSPLVQQEPCRANVIESTTVITCSAFAAPITSAAAQNDSVLLVLHSQRVAPENPFTPYDVQFAIDSSGDFFSSENEPITNRRFDRFLDPGELSISPPVLRISSVIDCVYTIREQRCSSQCDGQGTFVEVVVTTQPGAGGAACPMSYCRSSICSSDVVDIRVQVNRELLETGATIDLEDWTDTDDILDVSGLLDVDDSAEAELLAATVEDSVISAIFTLTVLRARSTAIRNHITTYGSQPINDQERGLYMLSFTPLSVSERECVCQGFRDSKGVYWPTVIGCNEFSRVQCPSTARALFLTRECLPGDVFTGPNSSACVNDRLTMLAQQMVDNMNVRDVVGQLQGEVQSPDFLGSTDVRSASRIIRGTADLLRDLDDETVTNVTTNIARTVDRLLQVNVDVFSSSQRENDTDRPTDMVSAFEDVVTAASTRLDPGAHSVNIVENVAIALYRSSMPFESFFFPDRVDYGVGRTDCAVDSCESNTTDPTTGNTNTTNVRLTNYAVSLTPTTQDVFSVAIVIFTTPRMFVGGVGFADEGNSTTAGHTRYVNTPVVSIQVINENGTRVDFEGRVVIRLPRLQSEDATIADSCRFFLFPGESGSDEVGSWDNEGCTELPSSDPNFILCECSHLTNFAVLTAIEPSAAYALSVITYVGIAVSVPCLLITFFLILCVQKLHSIDKLVIMHLSINLAIALTVFVFGAEETGDADVCSAIATITHYFLLTSFMWMLLEGINLYNALVVVFQSTRRTERSIHLRYALFAYLVPAVLVGITWGVFGSDGYGTEDYCWLNPSDSLYMFIGPIAVVIAVNIVLFFKISRAIGELRVKTNNEESFKEKISRGLKVSISFFCVLGITWVLGLIALAGGVFWQYLFTIFNAFQGVLIFVFHVLRDRRVRTSIVSNRSSRSRTMSTKVTNPYFRLEGSSTRKSFGTDSSFSSEKTLTTKTTNPSFSFSANNSSNRASFESVSALENDVLESYTQEEQDDAIPLEDLASVTEN